MFWVMAIFLRFDNSENEFNMKARLKDETKQILRNALHKENWHAHVSP